MLMPFTRPIAIALAALALSSQPSWAADKGAARSLLVQAEGQYRRGVHRAHRVLEVAAAVEGFARREQAARRALVRGLKRRRE